MKDLPPAVRRKLAASLPRARGKPPTPRAAGRMNQTEQRYASELERRRLVGMVAWWEFERVTFLLADDLRYTPDFMVQLPDGVLEFHEVKGFWRDDARAKIKVAAEMFPMFTVRAIREVKHGVWKVETL